MGQLYAYLGDAYLAKRDKALAKENYLKCIKTYPEYPMAVEGLLKLSTN
jgi:TolA-binding protein